MLRPMSNRYSASKLREIRALGSRYALGHNFTKQWHPIYNIPPKSDVPVVTQTSENPLRVMRWGTWTTEGLVLNIPFETAVTKAMWKNAMQQRRALILADGFFEWEKVGARKFGHYFSMPARDAFAIAALWFPANDDQPERCIMVTTAANALVAPFENRMPAILADWDAREWLSDQPVDQQAAARLCQPCPPEKMAHWHCPPEVNRTDFEDPSAIRPWQPRPQSAPSVGFPGDPSA